jgi:hypothetical protein
MLQNIVADTCLSSLHQAISSRCSHLQNAVEERHRKKFHQLIQRTTQTTLKKKWVINISRRKLNDDEISLLRKGLNYVSTPKSIPKKEILASVEQGIKNFAEGNEERGKNKYMFYLETSTTTCQTEFNPWRKDLGPVV